MGRWDLRVTSWDPQGHIMGPSGSHHGTMTLTPTLWVTPTQRVPRPTKAWTPPRSTKHYSSVSIRQSKPPSSMDYRHTPPRPARGHVLLVVLSSTDMR
ncbi:hypothetical protein NHX12_025711 [Muraenolepis orangiensis]|uniref:Uncharacterized protein n=1 Tax=Muraenolepis orangiensis TaxID=630683 RepID=A0A9Q0IQ39_9TELE|nr:hypothetical protein NHX12_025711 [Muraenolepis orangiensis]